MTAFEDGLWNRLVDEHEADRVSLRATSPPSRRRPVLIGACVTALAAVIATVVVALTAATTAAPAYALSRNSDGSITVTINDLATAVPALRARFAASGIDEKVVAVTSGCRTRGRFAGAPLYVYPQATPGARLTLHPADVPSGFTGVLAAEQLPGGKVALAEVAIKPGVPGCFPASAFSVQGTNITNSAPIYEMTPVPTTTNPAPGTSRARSGRSGS